MAEKKKFFHPFEFFSVSQHLFVKLIHTIKIAVIIYYNTKQCSRKTSITTTRRETAKWPYFWSSGQAATQETKQNLEK